LFDEATQDSSLQFQSRDEVVDLSTHQYDFD
jgi:hypothetical protein